MDLIEFLNSCLDAEVEATTIMESPPKWRVLREVEAKKAILRMYAEAKTDRYSEWDEMTLGAVVEHLAAVYRDRPAYQDGWKP